MFDENEDSELLRIAGIIALVLGLIALALGVKKVLD